MQKEFSDTFFDKKSDKNALHFFKINIFGQSNICEEKKIEKKDKKIVTTILDVKKKLWQKNCEATKISKQKKIEGKRIMKKNYVTTKFWGEKNYDNKKKLP